MLSPASGLTMLQDKSKNVRLCVCKVLFPPQNEIYQRLQDEYMICHLVRVKWCQFSGFFQHSTWKLRFMMTQRQNKTTLKSEIKASLTGLCAVCFELTISNLRPLCNIMHLLCFLSVKSLIVNLCCDIYTLYCTSFTLPLHWQCAAVVSLLCFVQKLEQWNF